MTVKSSLTVSIGRLLRLRQSRWGALRESWSADGAPAREPYQRSTKLFTEGFFARNRDGNSGLKHRKALKPFSKPIFSEVGGEVYSRRKDCGREFDRTIIQRGSCATRNSVSAASDVIGCWRERPIIAYAEILGGRYLTRSDTLGATVGSRRERACSR